MTTPHRTAAEPEPHRRDASPLVPDPRSGDKDPAEIEEPYDLPFPDRWPPGRPEYLIVVDQLATGGPVGLPPWPNSWKPGPPAPANQSPAWKPNHDRARP